MYFKVNLYKLERGGEKGLPPKRPWKFRLPSPRSLGSNALREKREINLGFVNRVYNTY